MRKEEVCKGKPLFRRAASFHVRPDSEAIVGGTTPAKTICCADDCDYSDSPHGGGSGGGDGGGDDEEQDKDAQESFTASLADSTGTFKAWKDIFSERSRSRRADQLRSRETRSSRAFLSVGRLC
jgi:hypothetical protein